MMMKNERILKTFVLRNTNNYNFLNFLRRLCLTRSLKKNVLIELSRRSESRETRR